MHYHAAADDDGAVGDHETGAVWCCCAAHCAHVVNGAVTWDSVS